MTPPLRTFTVRTAVEVLHVAQSEYEAAIEDGKFAKPVEYQDSRGFVWQAERMLDCHRRRAARHRCGGVGQGPCRFRTSSRQAWPALLPPATPRFTPGELSALISDIELHAARY